MDSGALGTRLREPLQWLSPNLFGSFSSSRLWRKQATESFLFFSFWLFGPRILSPDSKLYRLGSWFCCPPRAQKLTHSPLTIEYSTQSCPPSKPEQRIQATADPILEPHLSRKLCQHFFPTVLSQWHMPSIHVLRAWTVALPPNRP